MAITITTGNGLVCPNIAGLRAGPITFHVSGATGQTITFTAAGQTGMLPASGVTDSSGNATFTFRPTGTVINFPIDSYVVTATASGGGSVVLYAFFADVPPTIAVIAPPPLGGLVTAPTTYTVRIGGYGYTPNVSVQINVYSAGVWTPIAGPVLTDSTGTAVLTAALSGVGFFQIIGGGGPLGLSQIPYDTTGGTGPGAFPTAPVVTPAAPQAYASANGLKAANTATVTASSGSNVMQMPPGIKVTDAAFIPDLNDRLRQLATAAQSGSGAFNVGTHAARLALSAAKAGAGAEFLETDPARNALYYAATPAGGSSQWRLAFAFGSGLLSARPTDLGALDIGFEYAASDTKSTFQWTGAAWVPLAVTAVWVTCNHSDRIAATTYAAANFADGTPLLELDRGLVYRALTGRWIYTLGTMRLTAAQLNAIAVSTADALKSTDTGALFYSTDHGHLSRYNEAGLLEWAVVGDRSGSYLFSAASPLADPQCPAMAWAVCNGAVVSAQNPDGTLTAITTPASAAAIAPGSTVPLYIRL